MDANAANESGVTPWLGALEAQNAECLLLFESAGADLRSQDSSGRTAMHIAAKNADITQIKRLLSLGHDPAAYDHFGQNVLSYCVPTTIRGDISCFLHLYQHNHDLLVSKAPEGKSALDRLLLPDIWESWYPGSPREAIAGP